jgi:dethiobiotin synthetase
MMPSALFVTGTDTGVGKTVIAAWLSAHLCRTGYRVAGLKPVCSGDRSDARILRKACDAALTLDEVNPWHFRASLAPSLAAQQEGREVRRKEVMEHLRAIHRRFPLLLVEGAGGLLSPLGADFDSRDLIVALRAVPIIVCPNRLGAVNQSLLVLDALPRPHTCRAQLVLVPAPRIDAASRTNPGLLIERLGSSRVHVLPWVKHPENIEHALERPHVRRMIESLVDSLSLRA